MGEIDFDYFRLLASSILNRDPSRRERAFQGPALDWGDVPTFVN